MASLNKKGFGNNNQNHSQNKWNHVNHIVWDEKIEILLLQETHDPSSHLRNGRSQECTGGQNDGGLARMGKGHSY